MTGQVHKIGRQVLELVVPQEPGVRQVQEAFRDLYYSRLLPVLERVLDEMVPADKLVRLDSLELNLGSAGWDLSPDKLEERLEAVLRSQMEEVLNAADVTKVIPMTPAASADADWEVLVHYLVNGLVPEWLSPATYRPEGQLLRMLQAGEAAQMDLLRKALLLPVVLLRVAWTMGDATRSLLVERLMGSRAEAVQQLHRDLSRMQQSSAILPLDSDMFSLRLWESSLSMIHLLPETANTAEDILPIYLQSLLPSPIFRSRDRAWLVARAANAVPAGEITQETRRAVGEMLALTGIGAEELPRTVAGLEARKWQDMVGIPEDAVFAEEEHGKSESPAEEPIVDGGEAEIPTPLALEPQMKEGKVPEEAEQSSLVEEPIDSGKSSLEEPRTPPAQVEVESQERLAAESVLQSLPEIGSSDGEEAVPIIKEGGEALLGELTEPKSELPDEAPVTDSLLVESPLMDANQMDSPPMDANQMDSPPMDANQMESPLMDSLEEESALHPTLSDSQETPGLGLDDLYAHGEGLAPSMVDSKLDAESVPTNLSPDSARLEVTVGESPIDLTHRDAQGEQPLVDAGADPLVEESADAAPVEREEFAASPISPEAPILEPTDIPPLADANALQVVKSEDPERISQNLSPDPEAETQNPALTESPPALAGEQAGPRPIAEEDGRPIAPPATESPSIGLPDQHETAVVNELPAAQETAAGSDSPAVEETAAGSDSPGAQETAVVNDSPAIAAQEDSIAERFRRFREQWAQNPESLIPRPTEPLHIPWRQVDPRHGMGVQYAGLVITWPYLGGLFKRLLWLEKKAFLSPEAQFSAVHLLRYIATGDAGAVQDHELAFCKVLAGLSPTDPVPTEIVLPEAARAAADEMLDSLIANWPAIKRTSRGGLQQTFLQRAGSIRTDENGWIVHLERETMDILLDRIPWGYSTIRLGWQEKMIFVQW